MRLLQGLCYEPLADMRNQRLFRRNAPVFSLDVVRRLARPDIQHLINRFEKHRVAVGVEISEQFRVGQQPARTDAENQAPIEHVIEHRHTGGGGGRVSGWAVYGAGPKPFLICNRLSPFEVRVSSWLNVGSSYSSFVSLIKRSV